MDRADRLRKTLGEAEARAITAVVPGEALRWFRDIAAAIDELRDVWDVARRRRDETAETIRKQDADLVQRADALRAETERLSRELESMQRRAKRISAEALDDAAGSEEPLDMAKRMRKSLLTWIVDARSHDAETRTWLAEALYRDRGVGD